MSGAHSFYCTMGLLGNLFHFISVIIRLGIALFPILVIVCIFIFNSNTVNSDDDTFEVSDSDRDPQKED